MLPKLRLPTWRQDNLTSWSPDHHKLSMRIKICQCSPIPRGIFNKLTSLFDNCDSSPTEGKSKKQKIIDLSNDLQASGENKHSQSSQGMLGNLIVAPVEDIWQALMGNCPTQATQLAAISGFHKCSLTYMVLYKLFNNNSSHP
jgi:hypothetical protein